MKKEIKEELLDELLSNYKNPEDLLGPDGLLTELKRRLINRVLDAELTTHLGYEPHERKSESKNPRNGHSKKTVRSNDGKLSINVPRDREGDYEPRLIPKHQRHFNGFDDAIISLYSRGLSVREIQEHLKEIYKVEVSRELISNATEAVYHEVKAWQNRCLDSVYPIVFFDAVVVKVRHEGRVSNRAIYLALAINMQGHKEVLGMWTSQTEGAKFWLNVATELQNRGLSDIFICCVDGLSGFGDALETVFPKTRIQRCVVHLIRNSLKFVSWKERKAVAADLKLIYRAATKEQAAQALDSFKEQYEDRFPAICKIWQNNWEQITPFFDYPQDIRKVIYTTNAIESLNGSFRKISKNRNHFPHIESLFKLFYLSLKNISKKWNQPIPNWSKALNRFSIEFEDRMPNIES